MIPWSVLQVWHRWLFLDGSAIVFYWAALLGMVDINWIRNTWFLLSKCVLSLMERITVFSWKKHSIAVALLKYEASSSPSKKPHTNNFWRIWKYLHLLLCLISLGQSHSRKHRPWDNANSQRVHFTDELRLASEIIWRKKKSVLTHYE